MSAKKRILNILLWSVVSAAFIGPGTITTAAIILSIPSLKIISTITGTGFFYFT